MENPTTPYSIPKPIRECGLLKYGPIPVCRMKLILTIITSIALCYTLPLAAQGKNRGTQGKGAQKTPLKAIEPALVAENQPKPLTPEPPPMALSERYEIFTSFSQGKKLVGFTDPRYTANDKTDYLKSDAMTGNLEFTVKVPYQIKGNANDSTLQEIFHGTEYLRIGGQLTGWGILSGQNVSIPKTSAPINGQAVSATLNSATRPGIGFFFGFGKRDLEVDLGITMSLAFENEGSRTRRIVDANGNPVLDGSGNVTTEQVAGRGLFISNAFVLPTFKLAYGARGNLQFIVAAGRELFEFQRDYVQSYFRLPVLSFFKFDIGVGFFPNATLFMQPNFDIGPLTLGIRGGITLNYYDSELRRVSIPDAIYFGVSLSGRF